MMLKYKTENNVRQKALPTDDDGEGHSGSYSDSLMDTIRHSSHVHSCQMVTTGAWEPGPWIMNIYSKTFCGFLFKFEGIQPREV